MRACALSLCRRLLRRALTQLPAAFAAAREAAAMDVWPLPSLARALQLPFFGNSICVRSSKGAALLLS